MVELQRRFDPVARYRTTQHINRQACMFRIGLKSATPVLERSKLPYTVLTTNLIWNRHVMRVGNGIFLNFRVLQKPIKSSFALYVRRIATQDNSNCVHQDTSHKDSRSQTLTLPFGFCLPLFPLQYQEFIN